MARRLIGLDIGTNAVTIAEVTAGTPPRLDMFAQVALPRDAMREGEVADEAAVTDAVARLRAEVGLKKVPVRVGIASPRVVVRQVEMPVMSRDELMSALQFQAGDLIPIPIEDAVLDFAILGTSNPGADSGNDPTMQVLLVAAYAATVSRLVSAVEAGGLQVGAVDLIPLALTRALARPVSVMANAGGGVDVEEGVGAEGIVSFGGGVTAIAVHEGGVPQFVRVLGTGGRELTDAIATDLAVPAETAEALKRALSNPTPDEMVARARTSVDRPLSVLLDEVRSSIDYYRNQPGSAQLRRVIVTGGSAQLPGLPERLSALVGVPVEPAYMHDLLRIGDIGFAPDELPRLEPYLPAPVGLALGGANIGTVIDLLPRHRNTSTKSRSGRLDQKMVAAALVGVVALAGGTYLAHSDQTSAQSKNATAQAAVKKLRSQLFYQSQTATSGSGGTASVAAMKAEIKSVLGQDVAWPSIVTNVGLKLPPGVFITSFQGTHTLPTVSASPAPASTPTGAASTSATDGSSGTSAATAATAGAPGTTVTPVPDPNDICAGVTAPAGTVTMLGIAPDLPSVAALLDSLKNDTDLSVLWMSTAAAPDPGNGSGAVTDNVVKFTVTASLGTSARGHRLEKFFKGASCK